MNDQIKNLLNEAYRNHYKDTLDGQIESLSYSADCHTYDIYRIVYQRLIDDFNKNPYLESPNLYESSIRFSSSTNKNFDREFGVKFNSDYLVTYYNRTHSDRLVLFCPQGELLVTSYPFKLTKLVEELSKDGLNVVYGDNDLIASIDANKFRMMMQPNYKSKR